MAPDDRRSAILGATVPLLRERGLSVTTRELAQAAGVAEGTLFRVFPDKESLVRAAIAQAMDPQPALDELGAVDPAVDLPTAVRQAVDIMTARSLEVASLMAVAHELACRSARSPASPAGAADRDGSLEGDAVAAPRAHGLHRLPDAHPDAGPGPHLGPHVGPDGRHPVDAVIEALGDLLRRHGGAEVLRREPAVCARMLVAVVLTSTRTVLRGAAPVLGPDDVVELFLHGALDRPADDDDVPLRAQASHRAGDTSC